MLSPSTPSALKAVQDAHALSETQPGVGVAFSVNGDDLFVQWVSNEEELTVVDLGVVEVMLPANAPAIEEVLKGEGFATNEQLAEYGNMWALDDTPDWSTRHEMLDYLAQIVCTIGATESTAFTVYP